MTAEFYDILTRKRMGSFKVGEKRPIKNLAGTAVVKISQHGAVRFGLEIFVLDQTAGDIERPRAAQTYDADPASPRRR